MKTKNAPVITAKRIQHLYTEIAKLITSSLEVPKIVEAIMTQIDLFFQPSNWSLLRLDSTTQELFFFVAKGINQEVIKNVRLKLGEGIAGLVAKTGKPIFVKDAEKDPRVSVKIDKLCGFKTKTIIAVPIKFQKNILGVIELINIPSKRLSSQNALEVLQTIADFSAIALVNAMTYEYTLSLALRDPLTGVYNRARLENLIKSCKKSPKSNNKKRASEEPYIIAILIDIDRFKQINDFHGHRIGDEALISIAKKLQDICRLEDFVFRVGGDEFLMVLTNLSKTNLAATINRLHMQLNEISSYMLPTVEFSYGMTAGKKEHLEKLIKEADKLMYKNKNSKQTLLSQ